MKFAAPQMLWLLLLLLPLLAFLRWAWRKKQNLVAQFIQSRLLANLTVGVSLRRQKIRLGLVAAAILGIIVSLARPQWGFTWEEAKQSGLDIVVAIDTSRSMLAEDINPNRLERAKLAALDLMKICRNDRLGLVAFAGSAFLQCPLTLDEEAFRQSVAALDVNIMPQGGTALAETIQTAGAAFKDEAQNYKVLVILTDGEDHDGGAVAAAQQAAKSGLKIFTIGIGSAEGELIRLPGEGEKSTFLKDANGDIIKSRLNDTLLRQISGAGAEGGFYLNLRGTDTIKTLYDRGLAHLPKGQISEKLVRRYHEKFYWPLGLAIAFLLLEMFLPDRKQVPRRGAVTSPAGTKALQQTVTLLAALAVPLVAGASPASALREYRAAQYDEALKEYQRLSALKPEESRLYYNAGAAAYQAKKYDVAARNFSAAAASPDAKLQQRTLYNLGNTLFRAGEGQEETEKKIEAWEQSVQFYDEALKLQAQDADAKYNRELVLKKLEELKKQQQQEQEQESKDGKKGQKNKKKSKGKSQEKGDSEGEQDPDKKDDQQKKGGKQPDEKKDAGPDEKPGDREKSGESGEPDPDKVAEAQAALGQMTPQQAMQLLDSQKGEERALIFRPPGKGKPQNRVFKDW
jgi:Ca-activated chloride channel family protein